MQNAYAIMEKIKGLHLQGRSIVMITHDMKLVAEYATKVLVLSSGRQLLYGSVSELFNNEDVLTAARIDRPPVWDVTRELKSRNPHFPSLMSVSQFIGLLEASKAEPAG
jgi:energy-coupling factor transport system ATP-binding protein